jgi:glycerol-1-phosphate dehydrogenase [NAD(P)+]
MGSVVDLLLQNAEAVQSGTLEAMALLAKLITLGGLAMSLTHATTPLSGYEHVISHTLDLQNEAADKPLVLHGIQVALTTVLGCAAYQIFLRRFRPDPALMEKCYPPAEQMHDLILRTFHPLDAHDRVGEECWSDYRLKLEKWYASKAKLLELIQDWDSIQHELAKRTRTPQQIREIFALAGGPRGFRETQPPLDEETVRFAFLNAPLIRKRLTIGDLFLFFGWDRQALWREIWELTHGAL